MNQICNHMWSVKGSLTRDFRLQVFFMNQCPPSPQVFHWSHFEFFSKIRGDIRELLFITVQRCQRHRRKIYCRCRWHRRLIFVTDFQWSPVSLIPVKNLSPVTTTPAITFSPVSLTPLNSLLPVSLTPVITLSPVTTTPVNNYRQWQWHRW